MSTQMVEAVVSPEPSLSAGVCSLLQALSRGAKEDDSLLVCRGGGNVLGLAAAMNVPVREVSPAWVPVTVLRCLEERAALPWRVALPAMRGRTGVDPVSLSAVACSWTVERVYRKPQWTWPQDRLVEILAGLAAFAAPPTMVISALPDLVALWALDGAVRVAEPVAQDGVMSLLRSLAERLKGDVPAEDVRLRDIGVALPGTAPTNAAAEWEPASMAAFNPGRVYSLSEIEAALAAKKAK